MNNMSTQDVVVSAACARGSHKACRARVLNPAASDPKERWVKCECMCPHDRGVLAEAYTRAEAAGDFEQMKQIAAAGK